MTFFFLNWEILFLYLQKHFCVCEVILQIKKKIISNWNLRKFRKHANDKKQKIGFPIFCIDKFSFLLANRPLRGRFFFTYWIWIKITGDIPSLLDEIGKKYKSAFGNLFLGQIPVEFDYFTRSREFFFEIESSRDLSLMVKIG